MENPPIKLDSLQFLIEGFSIFPLHFGVIQFSDERYQCRCVEKRPKNTKKSVKKHSLPVRGLTMSAGKLPG